MTCSCSPRCHAAWTAGHHDHGSATGVWRSVNAASANSCSTSAALHAKPALYTPPAGPCSRDADHALNTTGSAAAARPRSGEGRNNSDPARTLLKYE